MSFFTGLGSSIPGIIMIAKPEWFYGLAKGWKQQGGSESFRLYLLCTRLGDVMCLLGGLGRMFFCNNTGMRPPISARIRSDPRAFSFPRRGIPPALPA